MFVSKKYNSYTVTILLLLMCYDLPPTKRSGYAETEPQFEISVIRKTKLSFRVIYISVFLLCGATLTLSVIVIKTSCIIF